MVSLGKERFSSRFGLVAAAIGMAIGAGNIWRFPRLAGQYGGTFLFPWLLFLFFWSIPLLIVEFAIGKKTRRGVVGAFYEALGANYTWMGLFMSFCTTAILFYYSVVTGWSLKYFLLAVSGNLMQVDHAAYWQTYSTSVYQPLLFHLFSISLGGYIIYRGIVGGVERFSKIVVPVLFILLVVAAIKAVSLTGADTGIRYFLSFDASKLGNYKLWLDALSQSAWSTGAGWGLLLTYAIYSRKEEKIVSNSVWAGVGNNIASLFAGLAVIPTVFALSASAQAAQHALNSGNQGLAFIAIPQLFGKMSGGLVFGAVFFLALFFAALSSLISMIELAARILMDFGLTRKRAVLWIVGVSFVLGAPSAISLKVFDNQDWAWGLGLILSGAFFVFALWKIGLRKFISEWLQPANHEKAYSVLFRLLFYVIIPLEFVLMLGWWLWQSLQWYPKTWWNPLETFSLGTAVAQWAVVVLAGIGITAYMNRLLEKRNNG